MTDEQQPLSVYPHFPLSDTGIRRVHQELGRWMHLAIEREINVEKLMADEQQRAAAHEQLQAEYQRLYEASLAFAEAHAPGTCQPTPSEPPAHEHPEPTPISPGVPGCPECAASEGVG